MDFGQQEGPSGSQTKRDHARTYLIAFTKGGPHERARSALRNLTGSNAFRSNWRPEESTTCAVMTAELAEVALKEARELVAWSLAGGPEGDEMWKLRLRIADNLYAIKASDYQKKTAA